MELETKIKVLGEPDLLPKFRRLLYTLGYPLPTTSIENIDIPQVLEFGEVRLFHTIWNRLNISPIIQKHTTKGGGKDLALFAEILAIHRICEPGSREKAAKWYPRTYLPILLELPPKKVYPRVLLRTLTYLQPKRTRKIERDIYGRIKEEFNIQTSRVDVDITSVYFEGEDCILAEFGYSRDGKKNKVQIVVGVAVDQEGFMLTHFVFPGNKTDVKTLKRTTHALRKDFGVSRTMFVMDRGMTSEENIRYMDRKKDEYLLALKLNKEEKALFDDVPGPEEGDWVDIDDKVSATIVDRRDNGRDKRYLLGINTEIAEKRRKKRELKLENARKALRSLKRGIKQGKTRSRKERERRIGGILRKHGVTKYIVCEGARKGLGFTFRTDREKIAEAERWDGAFLMVTTDLSLAADDLIEVYRQRDRVEKAIRTLKSVLDLRPVNVYLKEQVYGHIFICALAYQLRRVAQQCLKDGEVDMSIDEALDTLKRMKVVDIRVDKDDVQVHRMITTLDDEQKSLVDVFNMGDKDGQISL